MGSLCHELREDVDWLQNKWMEFQHLFGAGMERIELLKTVAPNFFGFLHKMMFEDAMLHVCRLTDSVETRVGKATRRNLTVLALPDAISDLAFRNEVAALANESRRKCEFARPLRSRRLAHTDLELALQGGS